MLRVKLCNRRNSAIYIAKYSLTVSHGLFPIESKQNDIIDANDAIFRGGGLKLEKKLSALCYVPTNDFISYSARQGN